MNCSEREGSHCWHAFGTSRALDTTHGPFLPASRKTKGILRCCFCGVLEDARGNQYSVEDVTPYYKEDA